MRTSKSDWFLDIAQRCAEQSTCLRRGFGAVIVDKHNTIVSTGYNGAPTGTTDCSTIGACWRVDNNIPSGSNYEKCRAVHAEMNALLQAGKYARESRLFLVGIDKTLGDVINAEPCALCSRMMVNAGISLVISRGSDYKHNMCDPRDYDRMWNTRIFDSHIEDDAHVLEVRLNGEHLQEGIEFSVNSGDELVIQEFVKGDEK